MDETANQIDTEMGELLGEAPAGDTGSTVSTGTPAQQPQTPAQTWKAGGREFKTPEELAKAYDNVWRLHGKTQNDAKPWFQLRDFLEKNPELKQKIANSVAEYQKARESGQSTQAAQQRSQLPPELVERLERYDAMIEDSKVEKEIASLRGKYKLDNNAIREVLQIAEANGGIALDLAYKAYAHDSGQAAARAAGAEQAKKSADATRLGGTSKAPVTGAAPKGFNLASDKGWRDSAAGALSKFGISD